MMIIGRMLQRDLLKKKGITTVVFGFIFLSAILVASGSNLIIELNSALNSLFDQAQAPHFVQMHVGDVDQSAIDAWAADNELVAAQQTVEMLTIDGSTLYLGESDTPETNSVMDISFVTQNPQFDYLLDLDNAIIELTPGEIAVPLYSMQQYDLSVGDTVRVRTDTIDMEFTIVTFVRDAQMNPAIVHSKRYVIHQADYDTLHDSISDTEHLIEFRLTDPAQVGDFSSAYLAAGLPQQGPTLDFQIFKLLNALSDGIVAGVIMLLSLLLVAIAILCLRFTILATLEEDTKEIGVMKAIGISRSDIKRVYLAKYIAIGLIASLTGYGASHLLNRVLSGNILLYLGNVPLTALNVIIPMVATMAIFLIVVVSCSVVLNRFNRIAAVEALRSGNMGEQIRPIGILSLKNSKRFNLNVFLGIRDVVQRVKLFWLLALVFFLCAVIVIVPNHFRTTLRSPSFVTYMGIGESDMQIDLRLSDNVDERYTDLLVTLEQDPDVERYAPFVGSQFTIVLEDGSTEPFNIETGDFSLFPLEYLHGRAPQQQNEIALSVLNTRDMDKDLDDTITLLVDGQEQVLVITGIYQDVTNGGRTAKATINPNLDRVLWYTISLDLAPTADVEHKVREYADAFYPARVNDLEGYIAQTLGNTVQQLTIVTGVAVVVGLAVSVLITSLFLGMLIAKDSSQIAIMRSFGFSLQHIRIQYLTRALTLLGVGILFGTIFSNTLGQQLVSAVWSLFGAARIEFVINPVMAYIVYPSLLMATVAITTLASIRGIKANNIADMITE